MKTVIARGLPPRFQGAPLSSTGEALPPVLRPMATRAGTSLRCSESAQRTVELHFSHVRSKLDVANRQEAVAKAIAEGSSGAGSSAANRGLWTHAGTGRQGTCRVMRKFSGGDIRTDQLVAI